tara:strand:+ start:18 stop:629 length:612 start_codon:yes stop_codon:yes gene_type:complete
MLNYKIEIPRTFELENLTLKSTMSEFAEERFKVLHENLDHIRQFLRFADESYTLEDEYSYINSCEEKRNQEKTFDFSIFENSTGEYIGSCSIMVKSKARGVFEFGYWLAKNKTGKGYMSEIISYLTGYLKHNFNPRRIIIRCNDSNLNSSNVALRNGFLFEGRGYCGDFEGDYYTFVKLQEHDKMQKLESIQSQLKSIFQVKI